MEAKLDGKVHHLIVYRPETSPLQIIRVLHGATDIENLL